MKMKKARKAIERKEIAEPEEFEGFLPGHNACAGCGASMAMRHITKAVGRNAIYTIATGCMEVVSTSYPLTSWDIPIIHSAFENAGATASGIEAALKHLGRNERVIAIAGDGGTYDIGLQALSGALERGHDILFICYDNEAYMNCLSMDSLIMTEEGLKRITEVKEGDKVYAFDQKTHGLILKRCTGVFNNGIKRVYELNTLHHTIKATSNHPFLVAKREGRGKSVKLVWKTLAELTTKDEIIVLKNLKDGKSYKFPAIKLSKRGTEKYLSQTKQRDFLADNEYFSSEVIRSIKFVKEEPTLDLRVEGEHNFIADGIVVHNTGIQRSGSTPLYAETTTSPYGDKIHGKVEWKKQLPFIAASHKCYVATANIAFMDDFYAKIRKALSIKGPKFIQVLTPCVIGWRIQSNEGVEIARLAVQTGIAPLYEIENGILKFNMDIKTKHVEEYLLRQGRFKHLNKKEILEIQERVDKEYSRLKYLSDNSIRVF